MPTKQFDAAIELSLDLMRTDAGIRFEVIAILEELEKEIVGKIAAGNYTKWGKARVNKQLTEIRRSIADYYDRVSALAIESTGVVAEVTAKATATALGVGTAVLPTETVLSTLASSVLVQGAAQAAWWSKQSDDTAFKFAQAVRQGIAGAETNQQIIARVRRELDVSQRHAAALVQTSVQTIANEARQATFEANEDLIKGYRWITALDTKVCLLCAPRADVEWTVDHIPINHGNAWAIPPIHFNDRCIIIAIIFDGPPGGQRASVDGPVSARTTFDGWLDRQSVSRQNEVLGVGRAKLYRDGKISLQDLIDGTGRPLTTKQLVAKHSG